MERDTFLITVGAERNKEDPDFLFKAEEKKCRTLHKRLLGDEKSRFMGLYYSDLAQVQIMAWSIVSLLVYVV